MKVIFTTEATDDLIEIAVFIAAESPRAARQLAAALKSKAKDLALMAERFLVVGQRDGRTIRRRVHGNYAIFYYVDSASRTVVIVRILHSARDHERILFPDD